MSMRFRSKRELYSELPNLLSLGLICFSLVSCTFQTPQLGTSGNPIKLFFVPSLDARVIDANAKLIKNWLEAHTPYKYSVLNPQSYIAVVEAFGSGRADIAGMNTFGYILAHEKYGAQARLTVIRYGRATYQSQIIARKDRFKTVKDLDGKKFAFVDPASLSGYILPTEALNQAKVKLADSVFAMTHDNVVSMVYQGRVDAGATYYSPPEKVEGIQDARVLVKAQYPDVEEKVVILKLTEAVPNDPITFRKELPEEMKRTIADAFVKMVQSPDGKAAFFSVYAANSVQPATDADYDAVRAMVKKISAVQDLEKMMAK